MAKPVDVHDLHSQVNGKGLVSTKNAAASSISVAKADGTILFPRVVFEQATGRVIVGDGAGIMVADADKWLASLKS